MIEISSRDPRPIYEQVKDNLARMIVSGAFEADERLPSVREMAASLTINPNTIQRAYRELEAEGYIYTVAGKGAFAAGGEQVREIYRNGLLKSFEDSVRELTVLGETPESLGKRITDIIGEEMGENDTGS